MAIQRERAGDCGSLCVHFRRESRADGGALEERMLCRFGCGLRVCEDCDRKRRDRMQFRLLGPWVTTVTLTVPHDSWLRRDAWTSMSRFMNLFFKRVEYLVNSWQVKTADGGPLRYAWVLEEHEDHWPHVHIAWTVSYLEHARLQAIWGEILGYVKPHVWIERIKKTGRLCRYLCKYATLGEMSREILAVMHRRRLFGTTERCLKRPSEGWEIWYRTNVEDAEKILENPALALVPQGWIVRAAVEGMYAQWYRFVPEGVEPWPGEGKAWTTLIDRLSLASPQPTSSRCSKLRPDEGSSDS